MPRRPDPGDAVPAGGRKTFEAQLERAMRPYRPGGAYLIGVSGGRDSVALLRGLAELGYRRLILAHLDHGWRGRAARGDARFVASLAREMGYALETARRDAGAAARAGKISLETAARTERHLFFSAVAARRRCRTVLLAHHADDQVETFLFNLLRGTGPAGLAAMRVESFQRVAGRQLRVVRPLLGVWRAEIDAYLAGRGWAWREDATNADVAAHTRNRLRAEVLPMLARALGRDVRPALWRTADILGAEEEWIAHLLAGPLPARLPVAALREEPLAKQRRLLRRWLGARQLRGIGYREVELVRGLLEIAPDGPAKVNLPSGKHVRRRAGVLFVE
jgi:tRNA(Ile)-lysidine synthase